MKNKLISFLKTKPIFLLLLPVFFVLHGYTENYDFVPVKDAALLALFYTGVSLIMALLFWLFFKNFFKAALVTFCVMAYQFFFGVVHDFLKNYFSGSFIPRYVFILAISLLVFILLLVYLKKTKKTFFKIALYLNSLLLVLILVDVGVLLSKTTHNENAVYSRKDLFTACDSCKNPDIYFIISDEYAGKIELKDLFQFDNTPFENKLKERGFHIVDSSKSNYNFTPFSVSSMLNMEFLKNLAGSNSSTQDMSICYNTIKNNNTLGFLLSRGYEFYNYSIFDFNGQPSVAKPTFLLRKTKSITAQTFTNRLWRDLGYHLITDLKIKSLIRKMTTKDLQNNERIYDLTKTIAGKKTKKPKFVYTHLVMPHYPYYFNSKGEKIPYTSLTDEYGYNKEAYIGYLQYANDKYLALLDYILSSSAQPPIIILMGDHGFREFRQAVDSAYHFMNLNAVFLPDSNYRLFYNGMSNINQFRTILNSQFKQQLPLLKDSTSFLRE